MAEDNQTIFIGKEISRSTKLSYEKKINTFLKGNFDWFRDKIEELEVRSRNDKTMSVIRFFGNNDYGFVFEAVNGGSYIDFRIYDDDDRCCLRFFANRLSGRLLKVFVRKVDTMTISRALNLLIKPSWIDM